MWVVYVSVCVYMGCDSVSVCGIWCVCVQMVFFRDFMARPLVEQPHHAQEGQLTPQLVQSVCSEPPKIDK